MPTIRPTNVIAGFALAVLSSSVGAQDTTGKSAAVPPKTGKAQIVGVVIDSLHGKYLPGADVVVEGLSGTVRTDSVGRFTIEGLNPGFYQVGIFHPLLDTLDVVLLTARFHIGPDSAAVVVVGVPSAATLIRRSCPGKTNAPEGSAVIGHVNDPETLAPIAGAEVSVGWTELEVSKQIGIRRTPHLLRDTTDKSGAFKICGLPGELSASLQARHGSATTAEIPIDLGSIGPQLFARNLYLAPKDSAAQTGNASVSGVVTLEGSTTNAGTRVELTGTDIVAMTDEKGEFAMKDLPSGSRVLMARHLGFSAETVPVDLSSREPQRVTIKLSKFVAMMDPVLVTARRLAALDKVGFNQRQRSGFGRYIGPERLQKMHPVQLTDILRQVPGIRVISTADGDIVESSRGATSLFGGSACVQYYVDDAPWESFTPGDVNQFVNAGEVVAVEVYQGTGVPPQYQRSLSSCTTIVIWTKFKIRN